MINRKGFKRRLEYWGVRFLLFMIQRMTLKSALKFADDLGWLAFNVFRIRRKLVLRELTRVFGNEKSEKEIKEIGLRVYQNFGKTLFEYGRLRVTSKDELLERVEFENIGIFEEALEKGRGAVIVTGHFGSWEMLGAATVAKGFPVSFLVGRQHNAFIDDMMNKIRSDAGIGIIPLKLALRGVIKALRSNQMVAMLSDQDAGKSSVFVDFLGLPARTPAGPALFSNKVGFTVNLYHDGFGIVII